MTSATETTIDTLNVLLRGALSTAEAYHLAVEKFHGQFVALELLRLGADYREAATLLLEHLVARGGIPPDHGRGRVESDLPSSRNTVLQGLKEREQQAFDDYESALENPELPADCHLLIRETLLPNCRDHLSRIADLFNRL